MKKSISNTQKFKFLDAVWYKTLWLILMFLLMILIVIFSFATENSYFSEYLVKFIYYTSAIYYDFLPFILIYYSLAIIAIIFFILFICSRNKNKAFPFTSCLIWLIGNVVMLIGAAMLTFYDSYTTISDANCFLFFVSIVNVFFSIVFCILEILRMFYHRVNIVEKVNDVPAYEKLMQIKELFDKGIITAEEYANAKRKYIDYI